MIHLAVGRLEIDWGKNSEFADHGALFQKSDVADVPYYYVSPGNDTYIDELGEERYQLIVKYKKGLSKPLSQVVDRVNLLGHTLDLCRTEFQYLSRLNDFDPERFKFEHLTRALSEIDVNAISADYGEMGEDFGKFFRRQLFNRLRLDEISPDPQYVQQHAAEAMENLSAYTVLQILALNRRAIDLPVNWQFADVVEGGWADEDNIICGLSPAQRFLIVTEGSSDSRILKKAFELRRPHVADFFQFVDMEEGYPFTGTGNVYRFIQGLISIAIQNNVVVLYDNDAEGVANYQRTLALNIPSNMAVTKLPDEDLFHFFPTMGPTGPGRADINGRAASIECYLDMLPDARIRWTSYNQKVDAYQGELLEKEAVARDFLRQTSVLVGYDYSRIDRVLRHIEAACVSISHAKSQIDWDYERD